MHRLSHRLAPVAGLFLILAACSADSDPTASAAGAASAGAEMPMESDDHASFAWGEPAEADEADRVIEVRMLDEMRFEPDAVEVSVGETVTFKVVNDGQIAHDFTLGDEETQDEHEAEMAEGGMTGMGHGDPNAMAIDAGESGELTWRFTAPATIFYGCHVPGHYDAGMVGTVTITES